MKQNNDEKILRLIQAEKRKLIDHGLYNPDQEHDACGVGAVVSIVKEVTESELLTLLEESVTLIVQSLNVPSDRAANVKEYCFDHAREECHNFSAGGKRYCTCSCCCVQCQ